MEIEKTVEVDVTVEVDEHEVLDEMDTTDILDYLVENRGFDAKDFAERLCFTPMEILAAAVYPFLPRNCSDKQSVMDAIREYLSREYN